MVDERFQPLDQYRQYPPEEMEQRARAFYEEMRRRRTVRAYARRPVARSVIENCLRAAGTAPSGANQQPWHFVVVADAEVKSQIRKAAEIEETAFYGERAPQEWLEALEPFGTDESKPFLEDAAYLIAIFVQSYSEHPEQGRVKHYYANESVGIATGMLISALHHAGLATLTHTPSPMRFLNEILGRPANERPFLLLVTGYPAPDARVPVITKKPLAEIATFF